jgi:succinate dehydrogenase hydrophobic anchor subunit
MDTYVTIYSKRYIKSKMVEKALGRVPFSVLYVILHIMSILDERGLKYEIWMYAIKQNLIQTFPSTFCI